MFRALKLHASRKGVLKYLAYVIAEWLSLYDPLIAKRFIKDLTH